MSASQTIPYPVLLQQEAVKYWDMLVITLPLLIFFGPTKVLESYQGKGIGKALLLRSLHALKDEGYIYAIIGGIGPARFYEKNVFVLFTLIVQKKRVCMNIF